jgi:hypothetical protein
MSNRDKRGISQNQPATTADKNHGGNSGNSGGTSGGRDKKRLYAGRDSAQAPQPSLAAAEIHQVPFEVTSSDQLTWEKRKDRGLWRQYVHVHKVLPSIAAIPDTR